MSRLETVIIENATMALHELRDACRNPLTLKSFAKTGHRLGIDPEDVALAEKTRLHAEITALTQLAHVHDSVLTEDTAKDLLALESAYYRLIALECVANDDGDGPQPPWLPSRFWLKSA